MDFFASGIPKQPNKHCKAFFEFSGSGQVATLNNVDNHCDDLMRSFTENTINCKYDEWSLNLIDSKNC